MMKPYRCTHAPLLVLAVVLLTSCSPLTQYRNRYDLCVVRPEAAAGTCDAHAVQQLPAADGGNYLLGFVEFDDQGQLWDRQQMSAVVDKLLADAARQDLLMVVFVHGWKHSAAPGDGNIATLQKVLAKLSEDERRLSAISGQAPREVAGVYVGWRGGSVPVPVLENLTFWDRKNTAQKVGHGGVTEVLGRLEQIKRDKDSTVAGGSGTRLAVIGHSFGGAVVHTALTQILEHRFIATTGPAGVQSDAAGFGNLVILINPAFEAGQFAQLSDMATERGTYFPSQLPVLAILTSEADYATRYAFKAGRRLSTLFESTRDTTRTNAVTRQQETISEDAANVAAVGHFEPYRTHRLYSEPGTSPDRVQALSSQDRVNATIAAVSAWSSDEPGSKIPIAGLTLERTPISAGRNPYLVIKVERALIRDHNDIDDPRIIEFLKQLIAIPTLPEASIRSLRRALDTPRVLP